jgi:hypothetical protein
VAQWLGQFSWRNHGTAIGDAQAQLEQAIEAFRSATAQDHAKRAKNVVGLAKRLLTARRRLLRTAVQADEAIDGSSVRKSSKARAAELERLETGGVEALLEEFDCLDALTAVTRAKR